MIAAQLYTVRERLQDPHQLSEVLVRLREIGYAAVEVAGLAPEAAGRLSDELKKTGLEACAAHESLDRLMFDLPEVAERCRAWGCRFVVVPSVPAEYHSAAGFRRFAEEAAEIASRLEAYGLELAYHNHSFELEHWDGKTGLDILYEAAPREVLKAELDTFWLQAAGASPSAWLRKLAGRAPLVHLKDMTVMEGHVTQADVGEGNLDWPEILHACRDAGTEWLVVELDEPGGDALESLAVSYRNLIRLLSRS